MKRFNFWTQWLFYSSLLFALFGIIFGIYGANPAFIHYNKALAKIFFHAEYLPAPTEHFRAFIWGPLGGTIACAYLLLAFIARFAFAKKEKWAWYGILVAFSVWILIDSIINIYYKVYFQVYLINFFSLLVKALPLVFTWKYFFRKQTEFNKTSK